MTINSRTPAGLNAAIPQSPPPGPSQPHQDEMIVLTVGRNGLIRINQHEVDGARLAETIQEIFKTRNERTLFVQADGDLLFTDVAHVLDVANGAGLIRVGLI